MGKPTGFLELDRKDRGYKPVEERVKHWNEFVIPLGEEGTKAQASRCMDCGIPYCHTGCPINNQIPDWNDLVYRGDWRQAAYNLHSTNNFPEVTGRICPAPCEAACTLNIDDVPVTIKTIECAIADRALENGWVVPKPAETKTGKSIAVIGSGPAGLAAAQQLARAGHEVHVYDKHDRPGGLLVYGIPDFKMEKSVIANRVKQMQAEGVTFHCNVNVGQDITMASLEDEYDAVLIAIGSEKPFDFFANAPGRDLDGIHFAMDFLPQQNRRVAGEDLKDNLTKTTAKDKHVIVIGGGDTGSDCIGTSFRQGAKSVTQLEIMPKPPEKENKALSWPHWPLKLRVSTSQAEGAQMEYSISTTGFSGEDGRVKKLLYTRVDDKLQPVAGTEGSLDAELILLAMGFSGPVEEGLVAELGVEPVARGRFKGLEANETDYKLPGPGGRFVAGDVRRGQSLVVWAIREGRQAAHAIDKFLMGTTTLPR